MNYRLRKELLYYGALTILAFVGTAIAATIIGVIAARFF